MAFNFKLPFAKKSAAGEADPMQDTLVIAPAAAPATPGTTGKRGKSEAAGPVRSSRSRLPLLGALPTMQQLLILGSVLVILFGVGAFALWTNIRDASHGAAYVGAAGQLRTLSQQIAKSVPRTLQGNPEAFKEMSAARDKFGVLLTSLLNGGLVGGGEVPPTSDKVRPVLDATISVWEKSDKNVALLREQEKSLVVMGQAVSAVNLRNADLLKLADELVALKLGGSQTEVSAANQLAMLTQRIAKNANFLLTVEGFGPEVATQLGKDINKFCQT